MGFFSGLDAEKYDRQYSDRELFRRILHYFKPQVWRLVGIAVTMLVISGRGRQRMPLVVSRGVDLMSTQPSTSGIFCYWRAGAGDRPADLGGNYVRRRLTVRAIADVLLTLATDAFQAAADHDLSFYDQYSSGRIQSRITSDTRDFGNLVTW